MFTYMLGEYLGVDLLCNMDIYLYLYVHIYCLYWYLCLHLVHT